MTSTAYTLTSAENRLILTSAYTPTIAVAAKRLGGLWNSSEKSWSFDPRDESRVRELCLAEFGDATDLVTFRLNVTPLDGRRELWIGGLCIAQRFERDRAVSLGAGVIVASGPGFTTSGGSRANPIISTLGREPTILEVRDVPRNLAERFSAAHLDLVEIVTPTPVVTPLDQAVAAIQPHWDGLNPAEQLVMVEILINRLPEAQRRPLRLQLNIPSLVQ